MHRTDTRGMPPTVAESMPHDFDMFDVANVAWWALVIAALSLVVSALTFWRNRTPTPRWELRWVRIDDDENPPAVQAEAHNRGRGAGRDVVFRVLKVDGRPGVVSREMDVVPFGSKLSLSFVHRSEGRHFSRVTAIRDEGFDDSAVVELEWSQEPDLHRRRTKRLTWKKSTQV
ncbi:hypothetical protein [Microbacterium sp. E-13]|uniref:hypothetical protein n=1 Tax=Microbacterium sp. E-13 TaxID=3404048 RepID=UPI003CE78700